MIDVYCEAVSVCWVECICDWHWDRNCVISFVQKSTAVLNFNVHEISKRLNQYIHKSMQIIVIFFSKAPTVLNKPAKPDIDLIYSPTTIDTPKDCSKWYQTYYLCVIKELLGAVCWIYLQYAPILASSHTTTAGQTLPLQCREICCMCTTYAVNLNMNAELTSKITGLI